MNLWKPEVEFENTVDQLYAAGDRTYLLVRRGPLSVDDDASWREVAEWIKERGMVLSYEDVLPPSKSRVPFEVRVRLYTTSQLRGWFFDDKGIELVIRAALAAQQGDG